MSNPVKRDHKKGGFLVSLGADGSTEIAVVGGKGASLGKLVKAGFPVPSGFVVTTGAYAEFLRANDLNVKIEKVLGELDYGDLDGLEKETAKIREAIVGCRIPDSLAREIVRAYGELGICRTWRFVPQERRRTWQVRLSPGNTRRTLMSGAVMLCWTRCGGAGRRCGPRALQRIVITRDSTTVRLSLRWWCRRWSNLRLLV